MVLPDTALGNAAESLSRRRSSPVSWTETGLREDRAILIVLNGLVDAMAADADELYAESSSAFLSALSPEAYAARIQRVGVVRAMDDPAFAAAVGSHRPQPDRRGRHQRRLHRLPTLTALDESYRVQVVGELIPTGR
ncbi:hypothetical protein ACH347_19130 [Saccharopolyspora sp. 5N102]|uniref:hypothetical protein n=1 Tax=Saccharopolyspora TaxID=1835 RepID=UPI0033F3FA84